MITAIKTIALMKELPTEAAGVPIPTLRLMGELGLYSERDYPSRQSPTGTATARASEIPKHDGSVEGWDPSLLPLGLLPVSPIGQTQWEAHELL